MNEMRSITGEADEVAAIRAVVERHRLPEFVSGYTVELGLFDDEPSAWIVLHLAPELPDDAASRSARAQALRRTREAIHADFLSTIANRYPYYRYARDESGSAAQP